MPQLQAHGQGHALMLRNGIVTAKSQLFEIFDAGKDETNLALAAAVGCQPNTVKRYREEWRTLQQRKLEPPPSQHHGTATPYRDLATTILTRAVYDFKLGHPCGKQCQRGEFHRCASDAALFLIGPMARFFFDSNPKISREKCLRGLGLWTKVDDG